MSLKTLKTLKTPVWSIDKATKTTKQCTKHFLTSMQLMSIFKSLRGEGEGGSGMGEALVSSVEGG